ncbi:Beta-galactosidase BoGH2A [Frondihabitans sp. 762G35]|nr:Beta-galactosidase BoGH2A [Frondihabitans sp. 762G35]
MTDQMETSSTLVVPLVEWSFRRSGERDARLIRLPHDAMISERRGSDAPAGADGGWFHGGRYVYSTRFRGDASRAGSEVEIRFEGVQGDAEVFVNDHFVGRVRSGYSEASLTITDKIRFGADNDVRIEVDNSLQPNSRWYSGSGLYRGVSVHFLVTSRFAADGLRIVTRALDASQARVEVGYQLVNAKADDMVAVALWDADNLIASGTKGAYPDGGTLDLMVPNPIPWSAEQPHRYRLVATLERDGDSLDVVEERVGLRTIAVNAKQGLLINGRTTLLRGACIHHDNGILGAATHRGADYRRVRILKDAGFNAIRSAHNPMSRQLLEACDELGMYVLDELADYWFVSKTTHDRADEFLDTWRDDAASMISKDRNHPSVIMYAIGNEIPETATPKGADLAGEITRFFHDLDPDRPVTVAVNIFLNVMVSFGVSPYKSNDKKASADAEKTSMAGSTDANIMVNQIGRMMNVVSRLPRGDKATKDVFSKVDIAGYNYGIARYAHDTRAYPDRVILGSETLPGDVARAWHSVEKYPAVIGDFVWAGWEYLGEAGVGVWVPGTKAGLSKPYPYVLAGPGFFDLIGRPDTSLRLAQAAWGRLDAPAIAVRPMDRSGQPVVKSAWRSTDAVESWSWRGCEGRLASIEVYSTDDQVELFLNGRSLGRRRAGRRTAYLTRFRTPYEAGELLAVGYRDGRATSRTTLRSAESELTVQIRAEDEFFQADPDEISYVSVEIADSNGVVEMLADEAVTLEVEGPAVLIGFGTADPAPSEGFTSSTHRTFRGRALAILRSTGEPGEITITATSSSHGTTVATLKSDTHAAGASLRQMRSAEQTR